MSRIHSKRVPVAVAQTVAMTSLLMARSSRVKVTSNSSPSRLSLMSCVILVVLTPGGKAYAYQYGQYLCILYVIGGLH
jgi:hypothetical protein